MNRNPTEDEKVKAHDRALELRKQIEGGKDFAQVAKESSDDPGSKAQGGELGWNERSSFVPAFAQAAFNLKVGELSEPVITPFGWHLLQVEEKKPAEEKPLASVSGEIAQVLVKRSGPPRSPRRTRRRPRPRSRRARRSPPSSRTRRTRTPQTRRAGREAAGGGHRQLPEERRRRFLASGAAPELMAAAFAMGRPGPLPGLPGRRLVRGGGGDRPRDGRRRELAGEEGRAPRGGPPPAPGRGAGVLRRGVEEDRRRS